MLFSHLSGGQPSKILVKLEQAFLGQVCVFPSKELRACSSRKQLVPYKTIINLCRSGLRKNVHFKRLMVKSLKFMNIKHLGCCTDIYNLQTGIAACSDWHCSMLYEPQEMSQLAKCTSEVHILLNIQQKFNFSA